MSAMRRGPMLLQLLLLTLAAHGLGAEGLDPWRGWIVFKQFVRAVAEQPDPGVSVQITPDEAAETTTLVFLRQESELRDDRLEPTGGVVCELTFAGTPSGVRQWEAWSFDAPSLDRFVDLVEEDSGFQALVVRPVLRSDVYWEEA